MQDVSKVNKCYVLPAADPKAIEEESIDNEVFLMQAFEDDEGLMCDVADSTDREAFLCGLLHELMKCWPEFLLQ